MQQALQTFFGRATQSQMLGLFQKNRTLSSSFFDAITTDCDTLISNLECLFGQMDGVGRLTLFRDCRCLSAP